MNESEARRAELLRQTRKLYRNSQPIPPVHPRYGNFFKDSAKHDSPSGTNTFFLRLTVGILCFLCYAWMDYSDAEVLNLTSNKITAQIEKPMNFINISEFLEIKK